MTESETEISPLAWAYERLRSVPLPPDDPEGFGVDGILEPSISEILRAVDASGRGEPVFWTGVGGAGVSSLLERLAIEEPLADRYYPIPLRLAESVHLLNVRAADLRFVVFLALMESAPSAGIDPPREVLRDLLGGATRKAASEEELRPGHLRYRLRNDGRFRARLREELAADPERLPAELADLAGKFSRNTVGSFRLTDETMERLRAAEVSDRVLEAVGGLAGRSFRSEVRFLRELEKAVGELQALHYRPVFLEHAWVEEPRDPLVLVDDVGKLGRGALETIWGGEEDHFCPPGVKLLVALPAMAEGFPSAGNGRLASLRPVALRDREGHPDAVAASRLREVLDRRLGPDIAPGDALAPLVRASGGLLRELLALGRRAAVAAAVRGRERLDAEAAEAAVRERAEQRRRFFDRAGHGPALARVGATRSLAGVTPAETEYLLRHGFVLPYGPAGEAAWHEPDPAVPVASETADGKDD